MSEYKILQIIPAVRWLAVYNIEDDISVERVDDKWQTVYGEDVDFSPLVCWALVEKESGHREIVGFHAMMGGPPQACDDADNFKEYWYFEPVED
jgi:hypothetical protein